ncbi:hypothetical protein VPHD529_0036 [Vibrio phage D529]
MNEDKCKSFIMGTDCQGYPNIEMCMNCPSMKAGSSHSPKFLREARVRQEQEDFYKEQKCPASERQVGGTHYTDMGIQPFEFTYANYGYMGFKAAIHTKVNKYLGRVKDDEVEQLKKARHCLDILIEKAELQK